MSKDTVIIEVHYRVQSWDGTFDEWIDHSRLKFDKEEDARSVVEAMRLKSPGLWRIVKITAEVIG